MAPGADNPGSLLSDLLLLRLVDEEEEATAAAVAAGVAGVALVVVAREGEDEVMLWVVGSERWSREEGVEEGRSFSIGWLMPRLGNGSTTSRLGTVAVVAAVSVAVVANVVAVVVVGAGSNTVLAATSRESRFAECLR